MKYPITICGPCSVESEEQVYDVAQKLAKHIKIDALRGGIWKPRTRPNSFEGRGKVALKWLKQAGIAIKKPVATEVANSKHVEEALKHDIDILWIGARTSVNPFAVQEIADALKGTNVTVMIKNPINPDLSLWLGAIERVQGANIDNICAIHRGFSTYEKSIYRNKPKWDIPIDLKRNMPEIPIICDPSHICGNRSLIRKISQSAYDLNFDGLMIEVHPDPDKAMSDAQQQITPAEVQELMNNLVIRKLKPSLEAKSLLDEFRDQIDAFDNELIEILYQRMNVVEEIAAYKKENKVTIYQPGRWDSIVNSRVESGKTKGLSEKFIKSVFSAIHNESIEHQGQIMNKENIKK